MVEAGLFLFQLNEKGARIGEVVLFDLRQDTSYFCRIGLVLVLDAFELFERLGKLVPLRIGCRLFQCRKGECFRFQNFIGNLLVQSGQSGFQGSG